MTHPALDIGLTHYLLVTTTLVAAGIATILTKRNAIGILIGVELVLNAAAINLVAYNHFAWSAGKGGPAIEGVMFTAFIIVLAAAEAAVALAIVLNYYNNFSSVDVDQADSLSG